MTVTADRPSTGIDLTSRTRLASAPRVLVDAEAVREQMHTLGSSPAPAGAHDDERFNAYAALLLCFTPKATASVPDEVTAPTHDELPRRLGFLTGQTLSYYEAAAVAKVLGMEGPSMTVREGRWLFNLCRYRQTRWGRDVVAPPREWVALQERLGIYVELTKRYESSLHLVGVHRTDPRVDASPVPAAPAVWSGEVFEFGGDWQAYQRCLDHGSTGSSHRVAIELMDKLQALRGWFSPRLVHDTVELVVAGRRYRLYVGPGTGPEPGRVRLRIDDGIDVPTG